MKELVDDILAERRGRPNRRRRIIAGAVAVAGHTILAGLIALAPAFAARRQNQVRDYMRVMIVPAKALGDATAPVRTTAPKPKPKPAAPVAVTQAPKTAPARQADSEPAPVRQSSGVSVPEPAAASREPESSQRRGGPDGSAFGTSVFGSSEASFDDPNFMYGYYVQQMLALIGSHWERPRASPGTEVIVHYNISRQGELSDIEIVKESGNRSFDLAGFRAVSLASPLPPLPQSYRSDSLGVNLVIR